MPSLTRRTWLLGLSLILLSTVVISVLSSSYSKKASFTTSSLSSDQTKQTSPGAPPAIPANAAVQPKVTWSQPQISLTLSPGESSSKDVTFNSDSNLRNVVIEPVPEIARFLNIQPSSITNVPANTPQSVQVVFSIPTNANLGTYQGTIHVRIGTQTFSQTLKIALNIWRTYTDSTLGLSFKYPPNLFAVTSPDSPNGVFIQTSPKEILLGGGALPVGKTPADYTTSGFVITLASTDYQKPFTINQWLLDFHPYSVIDTVSNVSVAGVLAYKVTFKDEILAGAPLVLIPYSGKLFGVSYNSTFEPDSPEESNGLGTFETILQTIQFN